jgi:dienelactone hydrolase
MNDVFMRTEWIDQISIISMSSEMKVAQPLVFFVHGVASDKRQGIRLGYELAKRGIYFVSLDTILRGDRSEMGPDPDIGELVTDTYPADTDLDDFLNMILMIRQTIKDLQKLIDYFSQQPGIDSERIGMVGYSMGGMTAYCGAGFIPQLNAIVSIASLPEIEQLWHDILLECKANQDWMEAMTRLDDESEKWARYMAEMDPSKKLLSYPERPLFLIHGSEDQVVAKKHTVDLYGTLKPLYKENPNNLKMSIYDGISHEFYPPMMEEIAIWFESLWF